MEPNWIRLTPKDVAPGRKVRSEEGTPTLTIIGWVSREEGPFKVTDGTSEGVLYLEDDYEVQTQPNQK
jgi:hypothetical protein